MVRCVVVVVDRQTMWRIFRTNGRKIININPNNQNTIFVQVQRTIQRRNQTNSLFTSRTNNSSLHWRETGKRCEWVEGMSVPLPLLDSIVVFIFCLIGPDARTTDASHQSANVPKLRKRDFRHNRKSHWGFNSNEFAIWSNFYCRRCSLFLTQSVWFACSAQVRQWVMTMSMFLFPFFRSLVALLFWSHEGFVEWCSHSPFISETYARLKCCS